MKLSQATQINKSRELGLLLNSNLMQRRILYSAMALMNPIVPETRGMTPAQVRDWLRNLDTDKRDDLCSFLINIHDFAKVWGLAGKSVSGKIKEAIGYDPSAKNKSPEIMKLCYKYTGADGGVEFVNVISHVGVNAEMGAIRIDLNYDFVPYLINLSSYTQIPFKATIGFTSSFAFAMFEFLLRRHTVGDKYPDLRFSLPELHEILGTSDIASYKVWYKFKERVLDTITRDFSEISGGGYSVEFEPVYPEFSVRGRPKIKEVVVKFKNDGYNAYKNFVAAKKESMEQLNLQTGQVVGKSNVDAEAKLMKERKLKDQKVATEALFPDDENEMSVLDKVLMEEMEKNPFVLPAKSKARSRTKK